MQCRVHSEQSPECEQTEHQTYGEPRLWFGSDPRRGGQCGQYDCQSPCPVSRSADQLCFIAGAGPQQSRRGSLHGPVENDPDRHKCADLEERGAITFRRAVRQNRVEIDRNAHDKPHVPCAEQQRPCQRQPIHIGRFREDFGKLRTLPSFWQARRHRNQHRHEDDEENSSHAQHCSLEPERCKERGSEKKSETFYRVLRACQEGHPTEQSVPFLRCQYLDRRLGGHLGQVLGHAACPLYQHHEGDRGSDGPGRVRLCQRQKR